jgi:hypothetical protein
VGVPHVAGSGLSLVISLGMLFRPKNQTRIPAWVHSTVCQSGHKLILERRTSIDTTTGLVETFTVGVLVGQITDTTTFVSSFVRSTVVAVEPTRSQFTSLEVIGVGRNSTSGTSVDRNLVLGKGIDTLHDIDFTSIRPVVSVHPPSGPCTTPGRSVDSVHDNHTTSVSIAVSIGPRCGGTVNLPLLSVYSDSFSATGNVLGLINSHDGVSLVVDRDQALVPGIAGGLVRNGTVCRVIPCPKVEIVKEGISLLF